MIIRTRATARVGLMGNPSDGFFGKTIAVAIEDFGAEVTLWESPTLQIVPNPQLDPTQFPSLAKLVETAVRDGYYGGLRLLFATCRKFASYCREQGIPLDERTFTIAYTTNIPRQVGLGGSSAIITAAMRALMRFYNVTEEQIPKPLLANLVLSVETEELEIVAGLQDRVIQAYGGTVFMDFARELMAARGYGEYVPLDPNLLPRLYLAYVDHPSDSGKIHSDVRFRFNRGDADVVEAMRTFARLAEEARVALAGRDVARLGELMNANFDLRRRIYGDHVVGAKNREMIRIARDLGFPAKFSGSGGAVIGILHSDADLARLRRAYEERGFRCLEIHPQGKHAA